MNISSITLRPNWNKTYPCQHTHHVCSPHLLRRSFSVKRGTEKRRKIIAITKLHISSKKNALLLTVTPSHYYYKNEVLSIILGLK